jgi:class 3 adenylate cyclase
MSVPLPVSSTASSSTALPSLEAVGERRQVTVMFSDLVGSTSLSARMDPEDVKIAQKSLISLTLTR